MICRNKQFYFEFTVANTNYVSPIKQGKDHNSQFAFYQDMYTNTRDEKHLVKMYEICLKVCHNYFVKYTKSRKLFFDDTTTSTKVEDMATWIIEMYLRQENFFIKKISAYAHFAFLKIVFGRKDQEMHEVSLEQLKGDRE